ncbi:MAG: hypothetical protein IPN14_03670 [Bacteroidetes bacterium]|nr:hypothetical protein [Bacteroidota bacterium]
MKIDPKTGIISGTPNIQGRFVVNVCCDEWRNGVVINTTKRVSICGYQLLKRLL